MKNYLLEIDLSGIQDFIFDVKSDRAARALKAKSFYVMFITEIIRKKFEEEFGDNCECIFDGGGNAYLQLNNVDENKVKDLTNNIKRERIKGIRIIIDYLDYSNQDFSEVLKKLNKKINSSKLKHPLKMEIIEKPVYINWYNISVNLLNANNYEIIPSSDNKVERDKIKYLGYEVKFTDDKENLNEDPNLILPGDNNNPLDFDEIAEIANEETGSGYIASLKLDVDSLGDLFSSLDTKKEFKKLSKVIHGFFTNELNRLLNSQNYKNKIYVVFAGGDDCFLIGPWHIMFDLAIDIRKKYTNYLNQKIKEGEYRTQLNDKLSNSSLSASLIVTSPKFPMKRIAAIAEEELHKAKTYDNKKDKLAVFGYVLEWDEFEKARNIANVLQDLVQNKGESRAVIQRIEKSHKGFEPLIKNASNGKIDIPRVWRLKYYLRNVKNDENRETLEKEIFNEYIDSIIKTFKNTGDVKTNPDLFIVAARWAEYLTKNKKEAQNG